MVYEAMVQHPTLIKVLKFLDNSNSREKVLRLLQYLVRLVNYYYQRTPNYSINSVQLLTNIQGLINLSRKPLRFFKNVSFGRQFINLYNDELKDSLSKNLNLLKLLNLSIYFSIDSVQWLKQLGILKNKHGKVVMKLDKYAYLFWSLSLLFGILDNVNTLKVQYQKKQAKKRELAEQKEIEGKDPLDKDSDDVHNFLDKETEKLIRATKRDLVKNALDMIISTNGYQLINVGNGIVGLSGVITSAMGIQELW